MSSYSFLCSTPLCCLSGLFISSWRPVSRMCPRVIISHLVTGRSRKESSTQLFEVHKTHAGSLIQISQLIHVYAKNYEANGQLILIRVLRYSLDGLILTQVCIIAYLLWFKLLKIINVGRVFGVHGCFEEVCQCGARCFPHSFHHVCEDLVRGFPDMFIPRH